MTAGFTTLPDLASRLLGGSVVYADDEFFAARDNLITPQPPGFTPQVFGPKGQVYDGWETRRRRDPDRGPGHDRAIIRLGVPGVVRGVVIDTAFFTGNFPPYASVEACGLEGYPSSGELLAGAGWVSLVPRTPLKGDHRNAFSVDVPARFTHVRLSIYPDGGVARLRVHGGAVPDPRLLPGGPGGLVDLAATEHGGMVVDCSDMFYSAPGNLLAPGLATTMADGWETARRRDQSNDWVLVRLAAPGVLRLVELDATHFKGNAPGAASLHGVNPPAAPFPVLPRTRLQPDTRHRFRVPAAAPASHARLNIYPDGGLARLRLYGEPTAAGHADLVLRWFNLLPPAQAREVLTGDGGLAPAEVDRLVGARPLSDATLLPW